MPVHLSDPDSIANPDLDSDSDTDELIAALEETPSFADTYRAQRVQQLQAEVARRRARRDDGFGAYEEVRDERVLMELVAVKEGGEKGMMMVVNDDDDNGNGEARLKTAVVVHFFKPEFGRCAVMNRHLESLAAVQLETRFIRINVDNAPFLVTKLKVRILPCVMAFVDGIAVDRIVGFEGLGLGGDRFTTKDLEARLVRCGVLRNAKVEEGHGRRAGDERRELHVGNEDEDEDDD